MSQHKEIVIRHGKTTLVLDDLGRLYDVATEFNLKFSEEQMQKLLEDNIDIALDIIKYGDDTEVGDRFFEAFVLSVTGGSWKLIQDRFGKGAYVFVEVEALKKGYVNP